MINTLGTKYTGQKIFDDFGQKSGVPRKSHFLKFVVHRRYVKTKIVNIWHWVCLLVSVILFK